ncbi:MAG: dTDP-glucose 4,6-dehydratase [Acidobacteriota bacterium]
MECLLVTGGAGFIGSHLVRLAVERGLRVVDLDALTYAGNPRNLEGIPTERHVFVEGSVNDRALLARLLEEHRPDAVIHLAAESHVDRSLDDPTLFVRTNINGTFELLEATLDHWKGIGPGERERFRYLQVSTDEVYGSVKTGFSREGDPYDPRSPYAASKAAADHLVRSFHHAHGLPTLVTSCGNNYGPRQAPEKLIPRAILCLLAGERLPIYGRGENVRDWIFVEDHCRALLEVVGQGEPGRTYHVGAEDRRRNLDVASTICAVLDELRPRADGARHEESIAFVEDRPGHDLRYALDVSRIRDELGWEAELSFEDGLRRTVSWYLENDAWVTEALARPDALSRQGLGRTERT